MNSLHTNPIKANEIAKLRAILGYDLSAIYSPYLDVDLSTGLIRTHQVSFSLESETPQFLNISTAWWQTEMEDYHTFVLETSDKPGIIPFEFDDTHERHGFGSVSQCDCNAGRVKKIEIVQSKFEAEGDFVPAGSEMFVETIVYDRGINIHCERGIISLATTFCFIEGDIQIRNQPVILSDDPTEVMTVRKTLE